MFKSLEVGAVVVPLRQGYFAEYLIHRPLLHNLFCFQAPEITNKVTQDL